MTPRATPPWWDDEDLKLRELMQAKEWTPSTPTPPKGSRKASSPDSVHVLYQPDSLHYLATAGGFQDHEEPTAILRRSEDAQLFLTYSRHLPYTRGPPLSPERHSRLYTHPSRGNRQGSLSEFLASFLLPPRRGVRC